MHQDNVDFIFRTLDYSNRSEVSDYVNLFWSIPTSLGDEYSVKRDSDFIESYVNDALQQETETNTFSGIVLSGKQIIGLYVLRRFAEPPFIGVHSSALWIHEDYRRNGLATKLKIMGEEWARKIGAHFINSNVLPNNLGMITLNEFLGYRSYKINMRKRIQG